MTLCLTDLKFIHLTLAFFSLKKSLLLLPEELERHISSVDDQKESSLILSHMDYKDGVNIIYYWITLSQGQAYFA